MQEIENRLRKYSDYKAQVQEIEQQVQELLDKKNALVDRMLNAPRLSDLKVDGGPLTDPVFDTVQKMVDVYGQRLNVLSERMGALFILMRGIEDDVMRAGLSEIERRYVRLRYFEGCQPKQIARLMDYSDSWLRDIKNSALKKIQSV